MTTCPSGVHYMHLVDHARAHVEDTYRRPWADRIMRALLRTCCPIRAASGPRLPPVVRRSARAGGHRVGGPHGRAEAAQGGPGAARLARMAQRALAMFGLMPSRLPNRSAYGRPQTFSTQPSRRKGRIALLQGCAQSVLGPQINEAAIRLLTRQGIEVVLARARRVAAHWCIIWTRASGARAGAPQYRRVEPRDRERARRDRHHGVGVRHDDQGLWLHAAQRPGLCRKGRARVGAGQDISEYLVSLDLGAPAAGVA